MDHTGQEMASDMGEEGQWELLDLPLYLAMSTRRTINGDANTRRDLTIEPCALLPYSRVEQHGRAIASEIRFPI